jgi:hypothetical protein
MCLRLLKFLAMFHRTGPIHVLGSHKTVMPCTLPPWVPKEVAELLADSFEKDFINILRQLKSNQKKASEKPGDSILQSSEEDDSEEDDLNEYGFLS